MLWKPNTCGCELVYQPGTGNQAEHFVEAKVVCAEHQHLSGVAVHDAVLQKSQDTMAAYTQACADLGLPFGSVAWKYDENNVLKYDIKDIEAEVAKHRLIAQLAEPGVLEAKVTQLDSINVAAEAAK